MKLNILAFLFTPVRLDFPILRLYFMKEAHGVDFDNSLAANKEPSGRCVKKVMERCDRVTEGAHNENAKLEKRDGWTGLTGSQWNQFAHSGNQDGNTTVFVS